MRKIFGTICAAMAFMAMTGCGDKGGFKLEGTIDDPDGMYKMAYLARDHQKEAVDSVAVVDGKFSFEADASEPWIGMVGVADESGRMVAMARFVAEPGIVTVTLPEGNAAGTPLNEAMTKYLAACEMPELQRQLEVIYTLYNVAATPEDRAEAEHQFDSVEKMYNDSLLCLNWALYNDNRDNVLGAFAMGEIANSDKYSLAQMDSILADASEQTRNYGTVKDKMTQLRQVELTAAGKHYVDVQGITMDGQATSLSEMIDGKVALVDFWASWCGPCRREIKDNLIRINAKYKDKGLQVIGLDVWDKPAEHAKAMQELGIEYPQLIDTSAARTATTTYGVQAIPHIMLIGKDGVIIARDLRGEAIEEAVKQALKQ